MSKPKPRFRRSDLPVKKEYTFLPDVTLERFRGTLVVVSHDETVLRRMDVLWRLHDGKLTVFHGNLDDCLREERVRRQQLEAEEAALRRILS